MRGGISFTTSDQLSFLRGKFFRLVQVRAALMVYKEPESRTVARIFYVRIATRVLFICGTCHLSVCNKTSNFCARI